MDCSRRRGRLAAHLQTRQLLRPAVTNAEGKDCNVFHGDYTGLAVGADNHVNVVWTGLNRWATSPQIDAYTGELHDGYAQDAMFARR